MAVEVECSFEENGRVRVWRIKMANRWRSVEQGRQWLDEEGRHVLIMIPGEGGVRELLLRAGALTWELRDLPGTSRVA